MAAVSRQMRSPLEGVLGFSDLLRLNAAGEPLSHRQRQAVERIRAKSEFSANVAVARTADEMTGTLLDILV